jgi:glycerophosphoryl diester phosphodiesterase
LILAHRGASAEAPENTLAAADLAWRQQADGLEGDFHLTADGHIVCIHDASAKRTTGVNVRIDQSTLADLQPLDAGRAKSPQFAGQRIPTLDQWFATAPASVSGGGGGGLFLLEIKCGPELVAPLKAKLAAHAALRDRLRIISFNADVIRESKRLLPDIPAWLLIRYKQNKDTGAWTPTLDDVLARLKSCNADGLDTHANEQVIDTTFVAAIRAAGYALHCWTINDPAAARRFAALGVDSITTDRPAKLREALMTAKEPG